VAETAPVSKRISALTAATRALVCEHASASAKCGMGCRTHKGRAWLGFGRVPLSRPSPLRRRRSRADHRRPPSHHAAQAARSRAMRRRRAGFSTAWGAAMVAGVSATSLPCAPIAMPTAPAFSASESLRTPRSTRGGWSGGRGPGARLLRPCAPGGRCRGPLGSGSAGRGELQTR
jgi:hypothetical protein